MQNYPNRRDDVLETREFILLILIIDKDIQNLLGVISAQ